jgi:hypothetical protein
MTPPPPCQGCQRNSYAQYPQALDGKFTITKQEAGDNRHGTCMCRGAACEVDVHCKNTVTFTITFNDPAFWRVIGAGPLVNGVTKTLAVIQCGDRQSLDFPILYYPNGDGDAFFQGQPDGAYHGVVRLIVLCGECAGAC